MSEHRSPDVEAWQRFCRTLESLGERILEDGFPNEPADTSEGVEHLARQTALWLGWSVLYADSTAPFFHRNNDLFMPWGGPNQDNVYHHAHIDPALRYRIRGHMHSCERFALTLRVGFMHMPEWGTLASITSDDLGVGPGDAFEILLGGDGTESGWTPIPERVTTASLREFYVDWQAEAEPATFTIECLSDVPTRARTSAVDIADRLDHACLQLEHSIGGWCDYLAQHRATGTPNTFEVLGTVKGVLSAARYAFLFWDLEPDEVLVVETDVPDAKYWGLQLARLGWYSPIDPVHRISSLNQHQLAIDDDRRVRVVLAAEDPGVPNWLDTAGHRSGLLTYRWFWAEGDPTVSARVVKGAELAEALPPGTATVTPDERRAQIAKRKAHLAWRFRS